MHVCKNIIVIFTHIMFHLTGLHLFTWDSQGVKYTHTTFLFCKHMFYHKWNCTVGKQNTINAFIHLADENIVRISAIMKTLGQNNNTAIQRWKLFVTGNMLQDILKYTNAAIEVKSSYGPCIIYLLWNLIGWTKSIHKSAIPSRAFSW